MRTALVTGANRGIGLEVCRRLARLGLRVLLTGRAPDAVEEARSALAAEGLEVEPERLDVASRASVAECAARLAGRGREVDVLVNNAAVYVVGGLLEAAPEDALQTMATNFFGPLWTCQAWMPGMLRRGYGRVVNVSSGVGSFEKGLPGPAGCYSVSKAALNALTARLAAEARGDVKVNAVTPGWVRTRMGGPGATRSAEQGAETVVWLATLPPEGPSGGFFKDRQPAPW